MCMLKKRGCNVQFQRAPVDWFPGHHPPTKLQTHPFWTHARCCGPPDGRRFITASSLYCQVWPDQILLASRCGSWRGIRVRAQSLIGRPRTPTRTPARPRAYKLLFRSSSRPLANPICCSPFPLEVTTTTIALVCLLSLSPPPPPSLLLGCGKS